MVPIPNPPIICYDLQTNSNARPRPCAVHRLPVTGISRPVKSRTRKVTIIQKDTNNLNAACPTVPCEQSRREEKLERRRKQLAMQRALEEVSAQLDRLTREHQNLASTFGLSHEVARRTQFEDRPVQQEDYLDNPEPSETETSELEHEHVHESLPESHNNLRENRLPDYSENLEFHNFQEEFEDELSKVAEHDQENYDDDEDDASEQADLHYHSQQPILNRSHLNHSHHHQQPAGEARIAHSTNISHAQSHSSHSSSSYRESPELLQELAEKFSFFKKDPREDVTIELSDDEFFTNVEDRTMLEARSLINRMNSALNELKRDQIIDVNNR